MVASPSDRSPGPELTPERAAAGPSTPRPAAGPVPPAGALPFAIPLVTRFRGVTVREGLLWRGPAGWAEWSPFLDYTAADCVPWLAAAREAAEVGWPAPVRDRVPVNCTVPAVPPEQAARVVVASGGCRTAKVKVAEPGQDAAADLDRVAAVRAALGPEGRIRVDANGAWDLRTAVDVLPRLDRAAGGLEYAEQPCAAVDDLARLRRRVGVPIAADESIRRAADPYRVAELAAADVAVLKVQPLGGVRACLAIAERIGLPVVVSSAVETSVGLAAGVALAAALPELRYACGLATGALLARDVVTDPFRPVGGALAVRRPRPDPALLTAAAAPEAVGRRWVERYAAVAAAGAGAPTRPGGGDPANRAGRTGDRGASTARR